MKIKYKVLTVTVVSILLSLFFIVIFTFAYTQYVLFQYVEFRIEDVIGNSAFVRVASKIIVCIAIAFVLTVSLVCLYLYYKIGRVVEKPLLELKQGVKAVSEGKEFSFHVAEQDEFEDVMLELKQLQVEHKLRIEELIQRDTENMELISSISHDIRTPLTTIIGYAEGILDGIANTKEKQISYVTKIKTKAQDMNELLNELLYSSKLDINKFSYRFEKTNLVSYIQDIVEEIKIDLENNHMTVVFEDSAVSSWVNIDRERFKRIVLNIIYNSINYKKKESKTICISFQTASHNLVVCFEDDGMGIESEKLPFIFNRFYRCDDARTDTYKSSGLGLAITKQLVEGHGGVIWARSEFGEGTKMFISLPYE